MAGFDNEVLYASGIRLESSDAQSILLMQLASTDVSRINYTGNPEGAVSANPSSLSHDPVSGVIYQKISGTGNTGWIPIGGGGGSSVYFQAYLTSPQAVAANDTTYTIVFDTAITNVGSAYNTANGIFTAPSSGYYSFSSTVFFNNLTNIGPSQMILGYTGNVQSLRLVQQGIQAAVTQTAIIFTASWNMPMSMGNTVQMQPFADGSAANYEIFGAPMSASAFSNSSVFSGYKVA